jgi:glyoxylase-like metal-dependent hydrolase (beta-lactamase superfamily II)
MTDRTSGLTRRAALAAGLAVPALIAARVPLARASAPMLGAAAPTFRRFKLGGFEITSIADSSVVLDGPRPIFGEDQSDDAVHQLMQANNLPTGKIRIEFTPVIVNTGSRLVLFDSGNAAEGGFAPGTMPGPLLDAGYSPDQIDIVVISHFHPDHIGGLMAGGAPAYPNARYVMGEAENNFWTHPDRMSGATEGVARMTRANVVPLAEKTTFIKPGDTVTSGITALEAFGHTPGHMAWHVESDGRQFVFFADTANHYVASLQRPDWHVSFDMDKENAVASRHRVLGMLAADGIAAAGYHMPFPSVGHVEAIAGGYRWVPITYQFDT